MYKATDDDRLVNISQIAEILDVSERTVHNLMKRGDISYIRYSGKGLKFNPRIVLEDMNHRYGKQAYWRRR